MAARINVKFLLILFIAVSAAVGLIGGLWVIQVRGDASRQARMGDEMMAEGDYFRASEHFARAVRRDPANRENLRKLEDTTLRVRPETVEMAQELYGRYQFVLMREAQLDSEDASAHLRQLEELDRNAELLSMLMGASQTRNTWRQVRDAADDMLQRADSDHPDYPLGYYYRGKAISHLHPFLRLEELEEGKEDFQLFLEAMPDHDRGRAAWLTYLQWYLDQLNVMNETARAAEVEKMIPREVEEALAAVPNGPSVRRIALQRNIERLQPDVDPDQLSDLQEQAMRLADMVEESNDPVLVRRVAQLLSRFNESFLLSRAADLYAGYVERNPDDLLSRIYLAEALYRQGQHADAHEMGMSVLESDELSVSFMSQLNRDVMRYAAQILFAMAYERFESASDVDERQKLLTQAREMRDHIVEYSSDVENDPQVMRADAKLHLAENRNEAALDLLERLIRRGGSDLELFLLSTTALRRTGQVGLALDRLNSAMEQTQSPNAQMWFVKASMEQQVGQLEAAAESIEQFLALDPDSTAGQELAASIDAAIRGEEQPTGSPFQAVVDAAEDALNAGNPDEARAVIHAALESEPENTSYLALAARLEIITGNPEAARDYLDRGLAIAPNRNDLRRMEIELATDDPVERIKRLYTSLHPDDEVEADVQIGINLFTVARSHREAADQADNEAQAEELRQIAERAESESGTYLTRARRASPNHAQLFEFDFVRTIEEENWSRAEELATRARRENLDQMEGLQYLGRLAFARGDYEEAVRRFIRATDRRPFAADLWRNLGITYVRVGNIEEAINAFEESYRINPTALQTINQYHQLLVQAGEYIQALRLIENARRLYPNNQDIWTRWLSLEGEVGSLETVLRERIARYRQQPEDLTNAASLALFYAQNTPTRELLLNENLERRYGAAAWSRMSVRDQNRMLSEEQARWHARADEIVDEVVAREGLNADLASLQAMVRRVRGDIQGGEEVLRAFIEQTGGDEPDANDLILLSRYQRETGQLDAAYRTLQEAKPHQSEERREVDRQLADFLHEQGQHERAMNHYERVLEVDPSFEIELRIVESLARMRQLDRAEEQMRRLMADRNPTYASRMLEAFIALGRAEDALVQNDLVQAEMHFSEQRQALAAAERLNPNNVRPHIFRAQSLLAQYQRSNDSDLLERAMSALSRADSIQANHELTGLTRARVHLARQNVSAAVTELERLVERYPNNLEGRRLLVNLYMQRDNARAAIATLDEAIQLYPATLGWYEMLANVYARQGDREGMLGALERAWNATQSPVVLRSYVGQLLSGPNPDGAKAMDLLAERREMRQADPVLDVQLARAQQVANRSSASRDSLRRSYRNLKEQMAEGRRGVQDLEMWLQAVQPMFAGRDPAEFQSMMEELSGGDLTSVELSWVARYWAAKGESGLSKAEEIARRAVERSTPENRRLHAETIFQLSVFVYMQDRPDEAVALLSEALEHNPDHGRAHNNLAYILTEYKGRPSDALFHAERAVALRQNDHASLDTLGWTYYHLGDLDRAHEYLERSLGIQETPATLLHMAKVLADQGQTDAASARLRRGLELDPDESTRAEIESLLTSMGG